jgi:hypothetical protein
LARFQELAADAIEAVVETVAARMGEDFARAAVERCIDDDVRAGLVIVHRVVGRVLVIPDDLAGGGVDGERAVGIEIVAGTVR